MFKMSRYQKHIVDHIKAHPEFIQPDERRNEVRAPLIAQPLLTHCAHSPFHPWILSRTGV